jgi:hypothetical protein
VSDPARSHLHLVALSRELLEGVQPEPEAARHRCDLAVIPYFEDERPLAGLAGYVDWRCSGALSDLLRAGFCSGRTGEAVLLPGRRTLPATRWVLLGLGTSAAFTAARAAEAATRIVEVASKMGPRDVLLAMPGRATERGVVEAVFGGVAAGLYARWDPDPSAAVPWWVVVDGRHLARLRRVLEGPPRAADD